MSDAAGRMLAIPTMLELDDVYAIWHRRITPWRWQRMVQEAFDRLYADGAKSGRLLTLSLHPWLIGQAHRIRSLEDAFAYMCGLRWRVDGHRRSSRQGSGLAIIEAFFSGILPVRRIWRAVDERPGRWFGR